MAQFFKAKPNSAKQLSSKITLDVNQVDHFGAGIAQYQGKVVFIPGALATENVTVQLIEQKKQFAKAKLLKINKASLERIKPSCEYYQQCGGCDLQHVGADDQRQIKQQILLNMMERVVNCKIELEPSLTANEWHYRRRARLATSYDKSSQKLILGFRAEKSKDIVSIGHCEVLDESLSLLITPISELLSALQLKKTVGHVELLNVFNGIFVVLRVTQKVTTADLSKLLTFETANGLTILLLNNEGQCSSLDGKASLPCYKLDDDSLLQFKPGNFIQVNGKINEQMVAQAIDWVSPQKNERILDLFCGVGNFSLPLARLAGAVIGVEGVPEMVKQAQKNAEQHGLDNLTFYHDDLSADLAGRSWMGKIDTLLLDPARAGAYESLQWLKSMKPNKVLYVSCNPASLARDSKLLLENGFSMTKLGLVDMFPQTHHIEAMALFEAK